VGQDQHREGDQPEAAHPGEQEAPQEDAARGLVKPRKDGGAGRGQAGGGLEHGVGERKRPVGDQERQGGEENGADPDEDHGKHPLA
jgi:hypothetical protein